MSDKVNPDILLLFFMSVIPEFFRKLKIKIEDPTPMTQKKKYLQEFYYLPLKRFPLDLEIHVWRDSSNVRFLIFSD